MNELARRLALMADSLSQQFNFEFIVVENGSVDDTFARLVAIHHRDNRFKVLQLFRNFGIEGAVTAGLRHANGAAAIVMCADLQDPPELIPMMLQRWREGYENVYTVIRNRSGEGPVRRALTRVFYWLANRINEQPVPPNASDFRLVDRSVYVIMNQFNEKTRLLRTLWSWIGAKSIGVEYDRPPRHGGKSTYGLWRALVFAGRGLMGSSTTPLKVIPFFGIALSAFSFVLLIAFAIRWYVGGVPFNGFGTILAIMLLLFGLLFLLLGMLSEYVGLIFEEVRNRPVFLEKARIGLTEKTDAQRGNIYVDASPVIEANR